LGRWDRIVCEKGTAQGGDLAPGCLPNIYLHYALDLLGPSASRQPRRTTGDMIHRGATPTTFPSWGVSSTNMMPGAFPMRCRERLEKFALSFAAPKDPLIEFGRFCGGRNRKADTAPSAARRPSLPRFTFIWRPSRDAQVSRSNTEVSPLPPPGPRGDLQAHQQELRLPPMPIQSNPGTGEVGEASRPRVP